jgi:hypothetical protein
MFRMKMILRPWRFLMPRRSMRDARRQEFDAYGSNPRRDA